MRVLKEAESTIRAAGREWTTAEVHQMRLMYCDPTMLTKDIARMMDINPRAMQRKRFKQKFDLVGVPRPRHGGRNTIGRLAIPQHAHPLVRRLYQLINDNRVTGKDVSLRAGLCNRAVYIWRHQMPRVDTLDAALNVLGYKLMVVPIGLKAPADG